MSFALHSGDFSNFEMRLKSEILKGLISLAIIIGGGVLMAVGRFGLDGSGIKLDPQQARKDIEPWARMGGGVLKDALNEADLNLNPENTSSELTFDEKLRRLNKLREESVISQEEYEYMRKKIIDEI